MILETLIMMFGNVLWSPGLQSVHSDPVILSPLPKQWEESVQISANAALVIELDSMGILFSKNAESPLPMASLTKMMTALIILENHSLTDMVQTPALSEYIEGSSMKLKPSDTLSVEDLLKGLMMNSGNDAATVLAMHDSGTVFRFVSQMNTRAKELQLKNTHFQNPHGLDAPEHFASAHDLAIIAKMLLQYPVIRTIANTPEEEITSHAGEVYPLKNTNLLLDSPFPVYGLKTGTTDNAGECIAVLTRVEGKEYFIILLGSKDRYVDTKTLLWYVMGKPQTKESTED